MNEEDDRYTGDGSVDTKGNPALKKNTGNWNACWYILSNECCERLAYNGISTNLITYLTDKLHQGNVSAARNVTTWSGTCYLSPLLGAVLADSYWGRYRTIVVFSTIYFLGMSILTLSATVLASQPTLLQHSVFFSGLYLVALGTGGIKPCVSSFGADQFDDTDARERSKKGSFFNWFYFSINIGTLFSSTVIVWTQEKAGWGLGFGIPAFFMGAAVATFLSGTPLYRFQAPKGSPFTRISQVLIASFRKRRLSVPFDTGLLYDEDSATKGRRKLEHTDELRCLDRAAVMTEAEMECEQELSPWRLCSVTQVEELKILIRMLPILSTGIVMEVVFAQISTMFVEQGKLMDTKLGSFTIPAASLSTFDVLSIIFWIPVYDKFLVPLARHFTGKPRGFSELQRMGIGLYLSIIAMAVAALVERERLRLVAPMISIMWQIPQYLILGVAEVFTFIGQMEFFYDESPDEMRSLCRALSLLNICLGSYLSSFLFTVVTNVTDWLPDDLNRGHLDYFFWLLCGMSFANLLVYVVFAMRYKQKKSVNVVEERVRTSRPLF